MNEYDSETLYVHGQVQQGKMGARYAASVLGCPLHEMHERFRLAGLNDPVTDKP